MIRGIKLHSKESKQMVERIITFWFLLITNNFSAYYFRFLSAYAVDDAIKI